MPLEAPVAPPRVADQNHGVAIGQAMAPKQQKVMEPRVMLLVLVGMYLGVSLEALFADRAVDWDRVTRDLTDVVAFGLFSAA